MPEIIGFNTQRLYQEHGQRISVTLKTDTKILMCDHSRGIFYEWEPEEPALRQYRKYFQTPQLRNYELEDFARMIMARYDKGGCRSTIEYVDAKEWPKVGPI